LEGVFLPTRVVDPEELDEVSQELEDELELVDIFNGS
jgi:hypothetical protein